MACSWVGWAQGSRQSRPRRQLEPTYIPAPWHGGWGRGEAGALHGQVPMGAEAHDIGDPSALVFGAGHE